MIYYNDFFYFGEIPVQFLLQNKMLKLKVSSVSANVLRNRNLFSGIGSQLNGSSQNSKMLFKMKYYFLVKIDQVNATKLT